MAKPTCTSFPPAPGDPWFARVLALAPTVHPVVRALGAPAGALPDLLAPR
jgi:hypothetical protein